MTIKVALEHRTSYTFDRPVRVYPHVVRLRPAPHSRTPIDAYSLRVEPADHFINWQQDALGNFLARLVFPNPTRQLTITVGLIADLKVINPFDFFIEDWAETWPSAGFTYPEPLAEDLKPYLRPVDENGAGAGAGLGEHLRDGAGHPHDQLSGRAQQTGQQRPRLQPADGTWSADTGFHA